MTAGAITRRQREVLDELSAHAAFSYDKARGVSGIDSGVAETLAKKGVLNKRYNEHYGAAYWIRRESEAATGTSIDAGFIVLLTRDLPRPVDDRRTSSSPGRATTAEARHSVGCSAAGWRSSASRTRTSLAAPGASS